MARATGFLETRGENSFLVFVREFGESTAEVWDCLTRPSLLETWIGTYTGDPATGHVAFLMTAEAGAQEEDVYIETCVAPRRFAGDVGQGGGRSWHLEWMLADENYGCILRFAMRLDDLDDVASVGAGWDYYLDRLAASLDGDEMPDWDDYYPDLATEYHDLATLHRNGLG
jgi:uncharacterized protein YndB with AHSA1/START domain